MWLTITLLIAVVISAFALAMTIANLARYRSPPEADPRALADHGVLISICIPARNEAANLEPCVHSLLAQSHRALEVLVYDDQSTDETPEILERLIAGDRRVRRVPTVELPAGWVGKQWGCDRMGRAATGEWLLFTDADVRFAPTCLERTLAESKRSGVDLLSTFPQEITGSLGEAILVPLIHFILFSYLPMGRMRATSDPSASAGCGQFLFVKRAAWLEVGGHASWRTSMHDGIRMPRALRAAGRRTDLFDGTALVSCRMYRGFLATWRGFAKNAYEGLGSLWLLMLLTLLHLTGHVLPWVVLAAAPWIGLSLIETALVASAIVLQLTQRVLLATRFRQSFSSALLHPLGVLLMTAVQWYSLGLQLTGRRGWKGRGGAPA